MLQDEVDGLAFTARGGSVDGAEGYLAIMSTWEFNSEGFDHLPTLGNSRE